MAYYVTLIRVVSVYRLHVYDMAVISSFLVNCSCCECTFEAINFVLFSFPFSFRLMSKSCVCSGSPLNRPTGLPELNRCFPSESVVSSRYTPNWDRHLAAEYAKGVHTLQVRRCAKCWQKLPAIKRPIITDYRAICKWDVYTVVGLISLTADIGFICSSTFMFQFYYNKHIFEDP